MASISVQSDAETEGIAYSCVSKITLIPTPYVPCKYLAFSHRAHCTKRRYVLALSPVSGTWSYQLHLSLDPALLQQIRSLLTDTVRWHLCMTAMQGWHHAAVGNSQSFDASDLELFINDGGFVVCLSHLTGAGSMVARRGMLFDVWYPVFSGGERMMCQVYMSVS